MKVKKCYLRSSWVPVISMVTCLMLTLYPFQQKTWLLSSIASSMWLGHNHLLLAALPRRTHRQLSAEIGVWVLEWGRRHFFISLSFKTVRTYFFLFCIDMPSTQARILEGIELSQHVSHKSQMDGALICYGKFYVKLLPGSSRRGILNYCWVTVPITRFYLV